MKKFLALVFIAYSTVSNAYDFYVKNSDGINICYNIVSSEMSNRTVEVAPNTDERIEKEVKIPSSVTKNGKKYKVIGIGDYAFQRQPVPSVIVPSSVTYIGEAAFEYCSNLKKIELTESLEQVCDRAFYRCSNLEGITLPNSVKQIGIDAFYGLNDNYKPGVILDPLYSDWLFAYCHLQCKNKVVIANGITTVAASAFGHAFNLGEVVLPSTVDSIGTYAFNTTENNMQLHINKITVNAEVPPVCDDDVFQTTLFENAVLQVSDATPDILNAYKTAEPWKNFKNIVAIKTTGEKTAADVNGDGVVNSTDAVELYNFIEKGDAGTASKADFDVNDDNLINSSDVVAIFNYIVSGNTN